MMDTNFAQAFYDVYFSFKEILRKKQRHLFCNMLDLLCTACKTTSAAAILKKITFDELVSFWVNDILPLLFDEDQSIQSSAVTSMEQGLLSLDLGSIQSYGQWADIKNRLIKDYAPLIHKLREERNQYWHRIWCLIIRILDREILKSASTINSFLSIVELGFRNSDNNVRAEAFTCWRLLIQIFATHKQLTSPKRLKLVCIPLKSSHSKTSHGATVKLRTWWYLIKCLEQSLDQHFSYVVEPFLAYCFGSETSVQGVAQQYSSLSGLAILCIAALVATDKNEYTQRLLHENQLEDLQQPLALLEENVLENVWKPLVYASLGAIRLLGKNETPFDDDTEQNLQSLIVKFITQLMIRLDLGLFYTKFCDSLLHMSSENSRPITLMINVIATEGIKLNRSVRDFGNYAHLIESLAIALLAEKAVGVTIRQHYIRQVFSLDAFLPERHAWRAIATIAEFLFRSRDEDFDHFDVKLQIWRQVSSTIIDFVKEDKLGCTQEEFSEIIVPWTIWPLKVCAEFTGKHNVTIFDKTSCQIWRNLLQLSENTTARSKHLIELKEALSNLLDADCEELLFMELFDGYVNEVLKLNCSVSEQYENMLQLVIETLRKYLLQKEKILIILRNILRTLRSDGTNRYIQQIKIAVEYVVRNVPKGSIDLAFIKEWKSSVLNIIRSYSNKDFVKQISDLLKDSDSFVIIPSVWCLKPDKLTDRQKERLAEKNNIPALYNDMSQSQDSLIKPWTPKKIVIAKEYENEIVLDGTDKSQKELCLSDKCEESISLNISDQSSHSFSNQKNQTGIEIVNASTSKSFLVHANTNLSDIASSATKENEVNSLQGGSNRNDLTNEAVSNIENNSHQRNKSNEVDPNSQNRVSGQAERNLVHRLKENEDTSLLEDYENGSEQKSKENIQDHNTSAFEVHINADANTVLDVEMPKELSPKKTVSKGVLLSSPPDRKLISNSSSPKIRPKPAAHLTGRGAQLINMIRNRKIDTSHSMHISTSKILSNKSENLDRLPPSELELIRVENTSTPLQTKDLLTFSKRLPPPSASPSSSILKRNLHRDSLEDIHFDSPACKKKRVSFHDPPVSVTKEYIKHFDENKNKPKRCLILDKNIQNGEKSSDSKCTLKRRSKLDSISEIEKFSQDDTKPTMSSNNQNAETTLSNDDNICCLKSIVDSENSTGLAVDCLSDDIAAEINLNSALNSIIEKCSLEEVLEKLVDTENESKIKSINIFAKTISRYMNENSKIKENVLETLSESHSKDFLDHAVRENLASVVCDRLNLQSVIEYVCEKSKINNFCRSSLLTNIPEVLRHCRQNFERLDFIHAILENVNLTDGNILDLINLLLRKRSSNAQTMLNVSESAIDSSSNL